MSFFQQIGLTPNMELTNKRAVITGGTTGIGFATAQKFIQQGARVLITGQDQARLDAAVAALGPQATCARVDVRTHAHLAELALAAKTHFGEIDILFANAGVAFATPLANTSEARYDEIMDINVKGVFFTMTHLAPLLADGASVILNTSWLNQVGTPGLSILSASKAAVRSMARTFSAELVSRNIRVNAVSPGAILTPIHAKAGATAQELEQTVKSISSKVPLGRLGNADEVADVAVFLASDGSRYMLGAEVVVDGGFSQL
jgi:NAD(P)-dependent dehydrogenase (short-subunit alcohol dehydrogenase family)